MHGISSGRLLEQQPMLALFLTIAIGYLLGEINDQGILARRRRGALRRARHGLVRAEVGAGADGRNARPRALPLRRRHPVRQAVLHRVGERRGQKANLLALVGVLSAGAVSLVFVKTMGIDLGIRAGTVRRFGDQHADAAGGDRDARQRQPGGGLFGVLSVRRGRADPVPLHRVHDPEAEDRGADVQRSRNARNRAAQPGPFRQDGR